ncbi:MAG: hypothetical protein K8W52_38160 [Deltaproteobacteria bacterium]|nr:hypothetical protein [Deltaproteobacteria bacterium]
MIATIGTLLGAASAQADDGYCEHARGVATSQSALLMAPELYGTVGYVEQPDATDPAVSTNGARLFAGVRIRLGGVYQGLITRSRASADCERHTALDRVVGATEARAQAAKAKVLDDALDEATSMLGEAMRDLDARRAGAQDVNATRIRVDELRALAAEAHRALDALPKSSGSLTGALASYYDADAAVERADGRLRAAQGWDISLRAGYNRFFDGVDRSPYFAAVTASFNLGWLLQPSANKHAAVGRRRMIREGDGGTELDAVVASLSATVERETQREAQVKTLVDDLDAQQRQLAQIGGDASRRLRQTVWFEWVKLHAEHAYLEAHLESLHEVMGATGGPK